MEECMNVLKGNLYAAMEMKGWTTKRLSVECGVSTREISYILCGKKKNINLSTLVGIARGIGVPVEVLISKERAKDNEIEQVLRKIGISLSDSLRNLKRIEMRNL